jgi:hypothetical protein
LGLRDIQGLVSARSDGGEVVSIYGRDNVISEGVLVGVDSEPTLSVRIWGVSGKKVRLFADLVRIERL